MFQRLMFLTIIAFFATMNVLLWRTEFGSSEHLGGLIPPDVIVRKILTAPDDSSLEIRRNGVRIGYCHWIAGTAEELVLDTPKGMEGMPEGMVQRPKGYAVHMEGGILTGPKEDRLRFSLELTLNAERNWRELVLRLGNPPTAWMVKASEEERWVEVRYGERGGAWARRFSFDELSDPQQLATELGGPLAAVWLPQLSRLPGLGGRRWELPWTARTDSMMVGGTRVQVYRLEGQLSQRQTVLILVSRVGEIMRVELPGGLSLVNDVLASLEAR